MSFLPLPDYITQYFWGDDLQELTVEKNRGYIIQTLLERGNQQAIQWLFATFDKKIIKNMLEKVKLSKKSAYFWHLYLS